MQAATYSKSGNQQAQSVKLPEAVFGVKSNHELLRLAYLAYLGNRRRASAKTLTRGEVRGGGRKPWRQKGTGRARAGSIRMPHWRGGGVTFGPTGAENYRLDLPVQTKRLAIRQALSTQAAEGKVSVIETFACPDGKVKPTIELLSKIGAEGSVLLVVSSKDDLVERATRNIPELSCVQANYLNVFDVLNADQIIISRKALDLIEVWLSPTQDSKLATQNSRAKEKAVK